MSKIIGVLMLLAVFGGLFVFTAVANGLAHALAIWLIAIALAAIIIVATGLLVGEIKL